MLLLIIVGLLGVVNASIPRPYVQGEEPLMKKLGITGIKQAYWNSERELGLFDKQISNAATNCVNGFAGDYPCNNVNMLAHLSLTDLGCTFANDVWGYSDQSGHEYVLACCSDRTVFVDVTTPTAPVILGHLKGKTSDWRDVKVYKGYAFIGSEAFGHGIQIFDMSVLTTLSQGLQKSDTSYKRDSNGIIYFSNFDTEFTVSKTYTGVSNSHNVIINVDSGIMYVVGGKCSGGLHMVDITDPMSPSFMGCFSSDGYTHDAQCVNYIGPDLRYSNREICFAYNEDTLTIVDVTVKSDPQTLSRTGYDNEQYTHQGWLNEAQTHVLLDDELDEYSSSNNAGKKTRTMVLDVSNLELPVVTGKFTSTEASIDHNQYITNGKSYQANYCAGLRILDASNLGTISSIKELGYFKMDYTDADLSGCNNGPRFHGAWSNYPFFTSGTIALNTMEKGLFLLKEASTIASTPNPSVPATRAPSQPTKTPTAIPTAAPNTGPFSLPAYTASSTESAANANSKVEQLRICKNAEIIFDTGCGCTSDTYMRLYDGTSEVTLNDDSCGLCSRITHTFNDFEGCKVFSLYQGCWSNTACGGTVEITTVSGTAPVRVTSTNPPTARPTARPTATPTARPTSSGTSSLSCVDVDDWNGKKKYRINKEVQFKGIKYISIKNKFKRKNPLKWSTRPKPIDNHWEVLGTCACSDVQSWVKRKKYSTGDSVQAQGGKWVATKNSKRKKPGDNSKYWNFVRAC